MSVPDSPSSDNTEGKPHMSLKSATLAFAVLFTGVLFSNEPRMLEGSYLGRQLPEIAADGGTWLNAEGTVTLG